MLHFKRAKKGKYEVTQTTKGIINFIYTVDAETKEKALEKIENKVNDPNFEPLKKQKKLKLIQTMMDTSTYTVKEIE